MSSGSGGIDQVSGIGPAQDVVDGELEGEDGGVAAIFAANAICPNIRPSFRVAYHASPGLGETPAMHGFECRLFAGPLAWFAKDIHNLGASGGEDEHELEGPDVMRRISAMHRIGLEPDHRVATIQSDRLEVQRLPKRRTTLVAVFRLIAHDPHQHAARLQDPLALIGQALEVKLRTARILAKFVIWRRSQDKVD
jgi:hypothetical protein